MARVRSATVSRILHRRLLLDLLLAGVTTTDDGRPMSINVEQIAGTLLVQHYVPEVLEPHRCMLVSQTDAITPRGRTTFQITWELSAEADGDGRCTYTNRVSTHTTSP